MLFIGLSNGGNLIEKSAKNRTTPILTYKVKLKYTFLETLLT